MKGVKCYELFGGIALKNHAFVYSTESEAVLRGWRAPDSLCCCCCCRPHSTNVLPAESSTRNHVAASSLSPQVARKGSTLSGFVQRSRLERGLVGICTQISGRRCDRASGRVGKVVRDVVDLQWKRDMRQGVVTCLCEVGLGCGAFPWIGGAQQEKQMVFGLEGLC